MISSGVPNLQTHTVMVVDNEPAAAAMLSDLLEKSGYRVIIARDGKTAIQRAGLTIPGLILLDAALPRMDGYETCRRLKAGEKTRNIPVIFMISHGAAQSKVRGFEAGGVDFISKPVESCEMLARVKTYMALHALHEQFERRVEERTAELALENERQQTQIAELKRAEEELFNSRQMLRLVLDNIPQRVFWKDRDSVYVGCNMPLVLDCGYRDPSELIGKTDYETASAATADLYRADDRQVIETGIPKLNYEEPQIKPDGSSAWLQTNKAPLYDKDGTIIGVLGTYEDITERKLIEDALRESEKRLSEIIDFLPDATFAVDREGRVIAWNRAIEEMTGVKAEQMLGKGDYEYSLAFHGVRRPILIDLVSKSDKKIEKKYMFIKREGDVLIAENKVRLKGVDQVLFAKAGPLFDSRGNRVGAIESIRDISDRLLAEAEVRAYAEELLAINRIAVICTSSLDLQSIMDRALDETLNIVGLDGGIICLVRPDNTLEPAAHRAMPEAVVSELTNNPVQAGQTIWGRCAVEGQPRVLPDRESVIRRTAQEGAQCDDISFHASFPLIVQQKCLGVLCLFTRGKHVPSDRGLKLIETVSAQLALGMQNALLYREVQQYAETLEEKVRQRTVQYEIANKELESFSYSVSHDLRAPLRGIEGWSRALSEDYLENIDEKGRKYLDRIRTETERMGKLIDCLLELSRVSRSSMKWEHVDLSAIARSISERLKETEPERSVEFSIQQGLRAYGDPGLLEAMMANLLGNAWKFTSRSVSARIEFGRTTLEGGIVWFVRDDGVGFDMNYAGRLFAPFQRMHRVSEFSGTGVGLATVQRIIHRHGGQVWVEAQVGKGATFYFTL